MSHYNIPSFWDTCRVLFKQRDNNFYPPSAYALALLAVRIPFQLVEAAVYTVIVYFWVGACPTLAPAAVAQYVRSPYLAQMRQIGYWRVVKYLRTAIQRRNLQEAYSLACSAP